jgi:RNA-dependent RNA polymerase
VLLRSTEQYFLTHQIKAGSKLFLKNFFQWLCRYSAFKNRFLRVGFANDGLQALSHNDLSDSVLQRFRNILLQGLSICNRKFVFLAFSSSQLREHGCWLYCEENLDEDGAPTAEQIRASVGDLHEIRVASKYAARLAQCFSSTFETLKLSADDVCDIPEVVTSNGEMFSDGVGIITSEGMRKVIQSLPVQQQMKLLGTDVSAVQIRMGGCKGVLACWDSIRCSPCRCLYMVLNRNVVYTANIDWVARFSSNDMNRTHFHTSKIQI